jgi:DHA1 family tetracycline resistance protein-like MFS transporter
LWQFVTRHNARLLISQYGLHTVAISGAIYLTPLWLAAEVGWGPREIGLIFGAVGVAMILIQGVFLDGLTRRFGVLPVLSTGAVIFFSGMLLTVFAESLWMHAGAILILFAGATCCLPLLNTLSTSIVDQSERGRMMGATTLVSSGGRVLGPLLAGIVLTRVGFSATWLVLVLPVLLVFIWSQTAAKVDVQRMHGHG